MDKSQFLCSSSRQHQRTSTCPINLTRHLPNADVPHPPFFAICTLFEANIDGPVLSTRTCTEVAQHQLPTFAVVRHTTHLSQQFDRERTYLNQIRVHWLRWTHKLSGKASAMLLTAKFGSIGPWSVAICESLSVYCRTLDVRTTVPNGSNSRTFNFIRTFQMVATNPSATVMLWRRKRRKTKREAYVCAADLSKSWAGAFSLGVPLRKSVWLSLRFLYWHHLEEYLKQQGRWAGYHDEIHEYCTV